MMKGLRWPLFLALLFSVITVTGFAATKTTTVTAATTWSALTWSPTGAPVAGDDVIINFNGSGSYAITGIPAAIPSSGSYLSFTVQGTNTAGTLTLTGSTSTVWTNRLNINNNVTFNSLSNMGTSMTSASSVVAASKTFTITSPSLITMGTGGVMTVSGTVLVTANSFQTTANSQLVIASGGIYDMNATGTPTVPRMTVNTGGILRLRNTATYTMSAFAVSGTVQIQNTATIGTGGTAPTYSSGTLEYARTASITASDKEWPATNGPTNVRLNFSTTSLILTLGSSMSRTIPGVLTMTQGKFAIGAGNTLTLNGTMSGTTSASNGNFIGSATSNLTIGGSGAFGSSIFLSQTNTTEASLLNLIIDRGPSGTVTFGNAHRIVTGGTYQLLDGTVTNTGVPTFVGTVTVTRVAGSMSAAPTFGTTTHYIYGDGTTAGNITTGVEFSTATLGNLTVNLPSANDLTLASSLNPTVPGTATLTLTSGDINLNSNTLTLGSSASSAGTYTCATTFGVMYGGTFRRWFTTTSMATALPSSTATVPDFPMGTSAGASRKVWVARSTTFSAGGSLSVTANNVAGVTPICPDFTDASIVVNQRSNSNWVVAGTGFAGSSATISYEMEQGTSTFTTTTPSQLRLVESSGIADGSNGTVQVTASTTIPRVRRTGVPLASYAATNTYYIGGNKPNIAGTVTAISSAASGAWNTPGTWAGGVVPTSSDNVTILTGHSITVNSGSSAADDVTINSGGTLTIGGGTLTLGSTCGGASTFTNNGTFTISSGTLNVGGNAQIAGTFNMSGGTINIDGNDGTSGGSVPAATPLLNLASNNMTVSGGAITILDPHFTATTSNGYALNVTGLSTVCEFTNNANLILGNATNPNVSTAPNGFKVNTYNASTTTHLILRDMYVMGGTQADSRHVEVTSTNRLNVSGLFWVWSGSEFYGNGSSQVNTAGNVTNDGVFETVLGCIWGWRKSSVSGFEATAGQTIGGTGTYTIGGALVVDNTNAGGGVTLGVPLTIGGTLTLDGGRVFLGANDFTMTEYNLAIGGTPSATAMFVTNGAGQFKRYLHTSVSVPILFPIGDNTSTAEYSPVMLDFSSGSNSAIRTIGARVTDANHPNLNTGATPTDYLSRYWDFTDNSSAALSYGGYLGYVSADVNGTSEASIKMQNYTGSWADVPNTGISTSLDRLTFSSATFQLDGASITGRTTVVAPPVNDDCPGTTLTVGAAATSGTVIGATQTLADNYGGYDDDDVWYNFTATATSALITLTQDVNPLPFDGVLELRDNTSCNSVRIQARNFSTQVTSNFERIRVSGLTVGQNYKIRIYSYDTGTANQGGFTIAVANTYSPTANDNVCSATTYAVGSLGNTVTGNTNTSYGFEIGEPTGSNWGFDIDNHPSVPSSSQWYKFTPTTTGTYTFTGGMIVGGTGLQMGVYRSNTGSPTCSDILNPANRVEVGSGYTSALNGTVTLTSLCLTAGVDYYIQLDSDLGQLQTPSLRITSTGGAPGTPTATAATSPTCTGFTANWGSVVNAVSYEIDVATDAAFTNIVVNGGNAGTGTSFGVSGLTSGNNFYYRIRAVGTCGESANSNTISVILLPTAVTATGNGSAGPVTICDGASFDLNATGGTGATSWSWSGPSYTDANQNPAAFNASNSGTYTASAINSCGSTQGSVVLNLNPLPALPNGLADQEICGAGSVTFNVTDPGAPLINQWSTDGVNHNGGQGLSYNVSLVSGQTTPMYARTFNTVTNCYSAWVQANAISHNNPVVAPTNNGPYCFGTQIQLFGPAGMTNYSWTGPNSFVSGVQNPVINNATLAEGGSYTLTVTDANTCSGSGSTTVVVSTCGTIIWEGTINTDWNIGGNWSGGFVPSIVNDVIIPNVTNDPVLTTGADGGVKNINVYSGATITVNTGKKIVVKGNWTGAYNTVSGAGAIEFSGTTAQTLAGGGIFSNININNSNGVTFSSGQLNQVKITDGLNLITGQLTGNNNIYLVSTATQTAYINNFGTLYNGTINGNITMERYNAGATGFRYLSMPINNPSINEISEVGLTGPDMGQLIATATCSPSNLAANSPYGNVMQWHENGPFNPPGCRQSGWYVRSAGTLENFRGYLVKMHQGTAVVVTGTPNLTAQTYATPLNNTNSTGDGWHLMGNPYPSPVQWTGVSGFGDMNLFSTVGIYTGTYAAFAPVQNKIIASMQGFFVRRLSAGGMTFGLPNASRRAISTIQYQSNNNWYDHLLEIDIVGNGFGDHSTLYFNSGATADYEAYFDARKMDGRDDQPAIYTHLPNGTEQLGVNGLGSLDQTYAVPLVMKPGQNGEFTLNFSELATFPASAMIYLEDLQTGTLTDLRVSPSYTFTSDINDSPERFIIRFEPPVTATVADATCETAGSIEVTQAGNTVWSSYQLRDNNNNVHAQGSNFSGSITFANLAAQEYILKLTHPSGYTAEEFFTVNGTSTVTADMNVSDNSVAVNEAVTFTANVANASELVWNFGDGEQAIGNTVSHSYAIPGNYAVTLTASNDVCENVASDVVNVSATTGLNTNVAETLTINGYGVQLSVEFNNWGANKADIFVFNTLGQRVESFTGVSTVSGRQLITIADVKPGYYFIQVVSNGKVHGKKVYLGAN